jgi:cell wall-associated NlpC family hydrolase
MRRSAAIIALLGGLVSMVGACGTTTVRPADVRPQAHTAYAPPPASAVADGPTRSARRTFEDYPRAAATRAWVAVPVATLWNQPGFARQIDGPVLQPEPQVQSWLASMSLADKLELDNIMATQALMDDPLTVIEVSGQWADVLVQDQKGSVYPDGVEGWIPVSQITFQPPPATPTYATVSVPVADAGGLQLSYGTRMPLLSTTGAGFTVATPAGQRFLPSSSARIGPLPASGEAVLQQAEKFLGLPYLWAGTSGYGFDCSGLTYAVYRQFGISLARDAGDQFGEGVAVPKDQLQPGDLMFFASAGQVHHVGIYAGNGMMLHAPQTGSQVQLVKIWSSDLASQYVGARRYLE